MSRNSINSTGKYMSEHLNSIDIHLYIHNAPAVCDCE